MTNAAVLGCTVNITAISIKGDSVACQFNAVKQINFDYQRGRLMILDATGEFNFGLTEITALTYTVTGINAALVIS